MIISGGVNIYPQEAENVLIEHPEIEDVAVIGVPDAEFGEEVKAIVVPAAILIMAKVKHCLLSPLSKPAGFKAKMSRNTDFYALLAPAMAGKLSWHSISQHNENCCGTGLGRL